MKKDIHILMAEDDDADAALQLYALRKGRIPFTLTRVQTETDFVRELDRNPLNLILSDYSMPGFDGYAALNIAKVKRPETPFIFVTGTMGEEVAIETLKNGATDYVLKARLSRLVPAVHRALREAREREDRQHIEARLRESHRLAAPQTTGAQNRKRRNKSNTPQWPTFESPTIDSESN